MESEKIKEKLISDISYYIHLGFDLIPLDVQQPNNTKEDFRKALNNSKWWKNNIRYTEQDLIKSINAGNVGYLIHTNEKTNICCVDFDIKNSDGTLKEETKESKHLLNLLLSSGTLTIKSPSGGYHTLYKKNNKIDKNPSNLLDGGFVDIKTKNQILYCGYRSDGFYNILDKSKPILPLPDDILKILNDNIELQDKHSVQFSKSEKKTTKIWDVIHYIPLLTDWDISNENLEYLFYGLNEDYYKDTKKWLCITAISKRYGLFDLWDKWSSQNNNTYYNFKNNMKKWHMIDETETLANINYLIYLHNKDRQDIYKCLTSKLKSLFNPDIEKAKVIKDPIPYIERIFNGYTPLNDINKIRINEVVNIRHLTTSYYKNVNRVIALLIKSGLGTGKTYNTFKYVIENDFKMLSISHTISLVQNQRGGFLKLCEEMNKKKIVYQYDYILPKDGDQMYPDDANIFTTVDSLIKTLNKIKDISEYYVYIDEISSVLYYALTSSTIKNRDDVMYTLVDIIKKCKGFIATDGEITDFVFDFIDKTGKQPYMIHNTYKSFDKVPVFITSNRYNILFKMYKMIQAKRFFTCCANTLEDIKSIEVFLLKNGVSSSQIKIYTSEKNTPLDRNLQDEWDQKYILYSPKITEGVDRTSKYPETVFSFYNGDFTLTPAQIKQQLSRNRLIYEIYMLCENNKNKQEYNDFNDCYEQFISRKNGGNEIRNNVITPYLDKSTVDCKTIYTPNIYSDFYIQCAYSKSLLNNNRRYILKQMLKEIGFIVNDDLRYNLFNFLNSEENDFEDKDNEDKEDKEDINLINNANKCELYDVLYHYLLNDHLDGNKIPVYMQKIPEHYMDKINNIKRKEDFINENGLVCSFGTFENDRIEYAILKNNRDIIKSLNVIVDKKDIREKYNNLKNIISNITTEKVNDIKNDIIEKNKTKNQEWEDMVKTINDTYILNKNTYGTKEAVQIKKEYIDKLKDDKQNFKLYKSAKDNEIKNIKKQADKDKEDLTKKANNDIKTGIFTGGNINNDVAEDTKQWKIYEELFIIKSEYIDIVREIYLNQRYLSLLLTLQYKFLISDRALAIKYEEENEKDQTNIYKYSECAMIILYRDIMRKYLPGMDVYMPRFDILDLDDVLMDVEITDLEYSRLKGYLSSNIEKPKTIQKLIIIIGKFYKKLFGPGYLFYNKRNVYHNKENRHKITYTYPMLKITTFKAFMIIIMHNIESDNVYKYPEEIRNKFKITIGTRKMILKNKHMYRDTDIKHTIRNIYTPEDIQLNIYNFDEVISQCEDYTILEDYKKYEKIGLNKYIKYDSDI